MAMNLEVLQIRSYALQLVSEFYWHLPSRTHFYDEFREGVHDTFGIFEGWQGIWIPIEKRYSMLLSILCLPDFQLHEDHIDAILDDDPYNPLELGGIPGNNNSERQRNKFLWDANNLSLMDILIKIDEGLPAGEHVLFWTTVSMIAQNIPTPGLPVQLDLNTLPLGGPLRIEANQQDMLNSLTQSPYEHGQEVIQVLNNPLHFFDRDAFQQYVDFKLQNNEAITNPLNPGQVLQANNLIRRRIALQALPGQGPRAAGAGGQGGGLRKMKRVSTKRKNHKTHRSMK